MIKEIGDILHRYYGDKLILKEDFSNLEIRLYLELTNVLCGKNLSLSKVEKEKLKSILNKFENYSFPYLSKKCND